MILSHPESLSQTMSQAERESQEERDLDKNQYTITIYASTSNYSVILGARECLSLVI